MNNRSDNNYSRIEINLLPPELAPGPAVRLFVILNFALVATTLATILVTTALPMFKITDLKKEIETVQTQINAMGPEEANYQTLIGVKEAVDGYGRIVSLASVDYVEVPLLLNRLSALLPEGVYLKQVQNRTAKANAAAPAGSKSDVIVQVSLAACRRDPALILATLNACKHDPLFSDCYLGNAEAVEKPLSDMLQRYGIEWAVSGSNGDRQPSSREYEFQIQARLHRPLASDSAPVVADYSTYLASIKFKTPPPPEEKKGKKGKQPASGKAGAASQGDAK